jgi:uncharacterized repeat protein (TIGR04076 family)
MKVSAKIHSRRHQRDPFTTLLMPHGELAFITHDIRKNRLCSLESNAEGERLSTIRVRVVQGTCQGGYHQIGDTWDIDCGDAMTPEGLCLGAFGAVFPYVMILLGNGEFYWEETGIKTTTRIPCADPKGIILEIERADSQSSHSQMQRTS